VSQSQSTTQYAQIAQITKAKGLKGQFVASECSELFCLSDVLGLEVWIVPPSMHGMRRGTIESVEQKPGAYDYLLSLTGVDDLSAAQELAGRFLLARLTDLEKRTLPDSPCALAETESSGSDHLHKSVNFKDVNAGDLGKLVRTDQTPAYELWVVDGPHGELLIPAVEEYVVEATPELITLKLPKGFMEINKK
jgi:16S rRNA processing protein RimM